MSTIDRLADRATALQPYENALPTLPRASPFEQWRAAVSFLAASSAILPFGLPGDRTDTGADGRPGTDADDSDSGLAVGHAESAAQAPPAAGEAHDVSRLHVPADKIVTIAVCRLGGGRLCCVIDGPTCRSRLSAR